MVVIESGVRSLPNLGVVAAAALAIVGAVVVIGFAGRQERG